MSGRSLDLELNRELGLGPNFRGVLVDSLVNAGPADKAGVKRIHQSIQGDIIIALDGIPIKDTPELNPPEKESILPYTETITRVISLRH